MISEHEIRAAMPYIFRETNLPLSGRQSGKVRDWYPIADQQRLLVTTDRLSAFDRVLACVPFKGQVLNQLAAWWFDQTANIIPNHKIALPDPNALVAVETEPMLIEVVVRAYITGVTSTALWYRYSLGEREIYGYHFPDGMVKNQVLPQPLITPTSKGGVTGHDERLTLSEVVDQGHLDEETWAQVQAAALTIFKRGQEVAQRAGLILVDTKYEFGRAPDGRIMLIDEVHTPDSSRFWRSDTYAECFERGEEPESFDKEFIRLAYTEKHFRGDGPAPTIPIDLWVAASHRYVQLYEMLTGEAFVPGTYPIEPRLYENLKKAGLL